MINLFQRFASKINKIRNLQHPENIWSNKSFSQEGEDLALFRLLDDHKEGFYVEIGAHHPFRFSNTYLFYKKGWRGICIDPLPQTKELFEKYRPNDITLELGVGELEAKLYYYMFNEPALNTFDEKLASERNGLGKYRLIGKKSINVIPLKYILDEYLPKNQEITFISIDVEGLDLPVLKSNDWDKYKSKFIIAESLDTNLLNIKKDEVNKFLCSLDYLPVIKTGHSVIYKMHNAN